MLSARVINLFLISSASTPCSVQLKYKCSSRLTNIGCCRKIPRVHFHLWVHMPSERFLPRRRRLMYAAGKKNALIPFIFLKTTRLTHCVDLCLQAWICFKKKNVLSYAWSLWKEVFGVLPNCNLPWKTVYFECSWIFSSLFTVLQSVCSVFKRQRE